MVCFECGRFIDELLEDVYVCDDHGELTTYCELCYDGLFTSLTEDQISDMTTGDLSRFANENQDF